MVDDEGILPICVWFLVFVLEHFVSGNNWRVAWNVKAVKGNPICHIIILCPPTPVTVTKSIHKEKLLTG